jgi:hypothetical protein
MKQTSASLDDKFVQSFNLRPEWIRQLSNLKADEDNIKMNVKEWYEDVD